MNHYEILGVGRQATAAEIRQAYLRLAREKHPDRFPDPAAKQQAQDQFKLMTEAFNTLTNERTRREYDAELDRPAPRSPGEMAEDAYSRGVQALEAGAAAEAAGILRVATHYAPDDARCHAALGRALSRVPGSGRDAVASLERAIELDPRRAEFQALLAEVFLTQGMKLRARRVIEDAQRADPGNREVARVAGLVRAAGDGK
jgi:curved DNA-binding protein CbpA